MGFYSNVRILKDNYALNRFRRNVFYQSNKCKEKLRRLKKFKNDNYTPLYRSIEVCFFWDDAKEGFDYWMYLDNAVGRKH